MGKSTPQAQSAHSPGSASEATPEKAEHKELDAEVARMSVQAVDACSWIYHANGPSEGNDASNQAPFGELVDSEFHVPDETQGRSMKWAAIWNRDAHQACFVFCGSCTPFDWVLENPAIKLARKTSNAGPILVHTGFWTAVDNDSDLLAIAFQKVQRLGAKSVLLCGHSKGGANALVVGLRLLQSNLKFGQWQNPWPPSAVRIITFGSPNVLAETDGLKQICAIIGEESFSRAYETEQDPIPHVLSPRAKDVRDFVKSKLPGAAINAARWWAAPGTIETFTKCIDVAQDVAANYRPCLHAIRLPGSSASGTFDVNAHHIDYYGKLVREMNMGHSSDVVRFACLKSICSKDPDLKTRERFLTDPSRNVCTIALGLFADKSTVHCVIQQLSSVDDTVRLRALEALEDLAKNSDVDSWQKLAPHVVKLLKDDKTDVKKKAEEVLASMTPEAFSKL